MKYQFFPGEEILCDYTVSAEMKRIWQKQLEMLDRFDQVCRKYGLRYYASGGTLLGAVRHRGYIPWDDDIDIHMLRADYNKFAAVAPTEMQPFFWQDHRTQPGYAPWHGKIRNGATTGCTRWEAQNWTDDFNRGIFIDIFPIDYLPNGALRRRIRRFAINRTQCAIWDMENRRKEDLANGTVPDAAFTRRYSRLCRRYDSLCAAQIKPTAEVAALTFNCNQPRFVWNSAWYGEPVELEFMGATISCPVNWDACLRRQYGDYRTIVKNGSMHSEILFDTEHPYTEVLKQPKEPSAV